MAWTTYSVRYPDARISSDAVFRTEGKWISDRLTDLGWAKTADPQCDWSSVNRPGTNNTKATSGSEIRKSTMSSADIYLKITYGTGYAYAASIGIWLQTGDGADGSGNLTGDVTTEQQPGSCCAYSSPNDSTMFVCGDGGNFIIAGTDATPANSFVGGVQRTCDTSGADTATGYWLYRFGYSAGGKSACQYCSFASGAATQDDSPGFGTLYLPRQLITTSSVQCVPLFVQNGLTWAPMRDIMGQVQGSMLSDFEAPIFGATRRYKNIVVTTTAAYWGPTTVVAQGLGIRLN